MGASATARWGERVRADVSSEYPKTPPEDVPPEHRERARTLQIELVVLEARLEAANFEDKEAYRRAIDERRSELDALREPPET